MYETVKKHCHLKCYMVDHISIDQNLFRGKFMLVITSVLLFLKKFMLTLNLL
jgi:hypothetical protein